MRFIPIFVPQYHIIEKRMKTTNVIRIPNPSEELTSVIENTQQQKKERMKQLREKIKKMLE